MGKNKKIDYSALDASDAEQVIKTIEMLSGCFTEKARYAVKRLNEELSASSMPLYRKFFVAVHEGAIVGGGGVKAVDWASNTHVLYLSAVTPDFRSRGIGKSLVQMRLDWLKRNFGLGRVLVSTQKIERFKSFGFKQMCEPSDDGRVIMLKEF